MRQISGEIQIPAGNMFAVVCFLLIFLERNSVRDDVSISRGITPACADDGANGAPELIP